jgi:hypothetical protein
VSKALFEAVAVSMAGVREAHGEDALDTLIARSAKVRSGFAQLMNDREFDRSVSQGTGDPVRVRLRFGKVRELLESVLRMSP